MAVINAHELDKISERLEAVTNQSYNVEIVLSDNKQFMCRWKNESKIDYILLITAIEHHRFSLDLAVARHKNIETTYSRRLDLLAIRRLISDPRQIVNDMIFSKAR